MLAAADCTAGFTSRFGCLILVESRTLRVFNSVNIMTLHYWRRGGILEQDKMNCMTFYITRA